jgi:hypothetical protein
MLVKLPADDRGDAIRVRRLRRRRELITYTLDLSEKPITPREEDHRRPSYELTLVVGCPVGFQWLCRGHFLSGCGCISNTCCWNTKMNELLSAARKGGDGARGDNPAAFQGNGTGQRVDGWDGCGFNVVAPVWYCTSTFVPLIHASHTSPRPAQYPNGIPNPIPYPPIIVPIPPIIPPGIAPIPIP